jgi:hypothetical protein
MLAHNGGQFLVNQFADFAMNVIGNYSFAQQFIQSRVLEHLHLTPIFLARE